MAAVQDDQAHAGQDAIRNALDGGVGDVVVVHMPPPEQDVGVVDRLFGAALIGIVERGGRDGEFGEFFQVRGDGAVHAVGIDLGHFRILFFVPAFVPDEDADRHSYLLPLDY